MPVGKNTGLGLPNKWTTTADLRKTLRKARLPRDDVLSVTPGSPAYCGCATAVQIAGVEVIVMARTRSDLHIAYNKMTNFGAFSAGAVVDVGIMSKSHLQLDDEL